MFYKCYNFLGGKMEKKERVSIPKYSLGEELVNAISHGIGGALAIVALVLCVIKASTPRAIVACAIYGGIAICLYIISCIYHALSPKIIGKKVLRVIDHCNVLLMVAGTYMPICLSLLYGTLGWIVFGIVWAITILAVVFNAIDVDKYQSVSAVCNLILGWGSLIIIKPLLAVCPVTGILLLIIGGIIYTIGAILYVLGDKIPYMHSAFHFFVIGGSIFHFLFIYLYCI